MERQGRGESDGRGEQGGGEGVGQARDEGWSLFCHVHAHLVSCSFQVGLLINDLK